MRDGLSAIDASMSTGLRPRILHCHSTFSLGGKEARAVRLMNWFGDAADHVVLSAMPDQMGARHAINAEVPVAFPGAETAPPLHGMPSPGRYIGLARYMQAFDLVLSYNWGSMDAVMAHRLLGGRMALPPLIHHEDGFNADETKRLDWRRNLFRRIALKTADQVVVPSHVLERVARDVWRGGARVQRISNGICVADYARPPRADALPAFVRGPDDIVVGTIAGLRPVKDIPFLVRALSLTPPNLRLIVVGEGSEAGAIAAEAARCGVADRVMLTGFLTDPRRFVGHFDMMALSSLSEQQPIAVMEAMAASLPVVAPQVGDVPYMVSARNQPFITLRSESALADALTTLAADRSLRQTIGAENHAKALSEFDEAPMIERYTALYAAAMRRPTSALRADTK